MFKREGLEPPTKSVLGLRIDFAGKFYRITTILITNCLTVFVFGHIPINNPVGVLGGVALNGLLPVLAHYEVERLSFYRKDLNLALLALGLAELVAVLGGDGNLRVHLHACQFAFLHLR